MKRIVATAFALILASPALAQPEPAPAAQPANMDNAVDAVPDAPEATYEPVVEHSNSMIYSGMGGPIEERTNYPPCRPGAGDDNCIQLYERGVTGRGD